MADDMMLQKWTIAFKLLDFNKNDVLSIDDREACKRSFREIYQPDDTHSPVMMSHIDNFWAKSMFLTNEPDWSKIIQLDDFISSRRKAYEQDGKAVRNTIHQATMSFISAGDISGTGRLSFDEFKKLHEALNQKDEKFIKIMFDAIGPDADGRVSNVQISDFYTELTMGADSTKHKQYLAALAAAGFM
ncbi:uncharacterized protein LOC127866625 isoform X2 [Dreissena polymorpha]|uniref:Sarcoplasmic calcium-binding protein n=2 Tax=Dreissena polymorpha TaxID=45954 RepID=A0A9D4RCU4_DREPO|nr:uncharacterized protein LOC127866625 isoform X2 [Dreissena polymorpha]XP_052263286.1 uncharacterized protein LOC127866625 isoform X2 [Dreissena polymorpha]XP_052263288.1 uncharacterized protein LOC127866625 isoform X2 [Dreissena polymorpha]KAH3863701.1 hypothetical protein DPMN_026691 [Dreissena polymorpha]